MADINSIADQVAKRISSIAGRASTVAGGIALLAASTGAMAYLVGLLVIPGGWRWVWAVAGLILCAIPGAAAFIAFRRLKATTRTVAETGADLRTIVKDSRIRSAITDLAHFDDERGKSAPLVELGKELLHLKTAVFEHKDEVVNLRNSMLAVTSFPGLMAMGTVGAFTLMIGAGAAVLLKVLF